MKTAEGKVDDPRLERQRLKARLVRVQDYASPRTFTNPMTSLLACRNELRALLTLLGDHLQHEEEVLKVLSLRPDERHAYEEGLAENRSRLRELRALSESADQVLTESAEGHDLSGIARALCGYLTACIGEILRHEGTSCPVSGAPAAK